MYISTIFSLVIASFFISTSSYAGLWETPEQLRQENIQQQNEILKQQEEQEKLNQRITQQQKELEQQAREYKKELDYLKKQQENTLKHMKQERYINQTNRDKKEKEYQQNSYEQKLTKENETFAKSNARTSSEINTYFDNNYYRKASQNIIKKKFSANEVMNMNSAHKQYILEVARKALNGDPVAQVALGNHYREGVGLEKNEALAIKWFNKAADQGNQNAKKFLEIIRTNDNVHDIIIAKQIGNIQDVIKYGAVNLSWEDQKEVIISSLKLELSTGHDNLYRALSAD